MPDRPETARSEWLDRVRDSGLRATAGRLAALSHLEAHPHSSAAEIYGALAEQLPSLSLQSVHNIVHDLSAAGLVRRIELPGSEAARYETRTLDNHHHVQCIVCGRIEDVECTVGHAPCLTPSQYHGMRILTADVTFQGVCAACEDQASTQQSPHPVLTLPQEGKLND